MNDIIEWKPEHMLEVKLKEPDDFLKIRETLTRIGVASRKEELFALDGKTANLFVNDVERRNTISQLLSDWGLVELINPVENKAPLSQIKVLPFKEKSEWILEPKYNIGKKPSDGESENENTKKEDTKPQPEPTV
jgi:hypothetical protein